MNIDGLYTTDQAIPAGDGAPRTHGGFQALTIFLVFLLISIIPLLTHPLPPLEDYANHVSRMQVMADAGRTP